MIPGLSLLVGWGEWGWVDGWEEWCINPGFLVNCTVYLSYSHPLRACLTFFSVAIIACLFSLFLLYSPLRAKI